MSKDFKKGVEAMRDVLAAEFERLSTGNFTGDEVADLIRQAPGPQDDKLQSP